MDARPILVLASLIATFVVSAVGSTPVHSAEPPPTRQAKDVSRAAWDSIKALGLPPQTPLPDQEKWILKSVDKASALFWNPANATNLQGTIGSFIDRFGREGAQADFDWMLVSPDLTLASNAMVIGGPKKWSGNEISGEYIEGLREAQREICRAEVERFLADPSLFQRYYRAVLWSGTFFKTQGMETRALSANVGTLRDNFPGAPDEDYWPYARALIMLVHATARDDLLVNANPMDLRRVFFAWNKWLNDDHVFEHLRPDNEKCVWHYEPTLPANPVSISPVQLPDRPFPEMKAPLAVATDFYDLQVDWEEEDDAGRAALRTQLSPVGHARVRRQQP